MKKGTVEKYKYKNTAVIIDGDNLYRVLRDAGLKVSNLRMFVSACIKKEDSLTRIENLDNVLYNPVIYIESRLVGEKLRRKQNERLNSWKNKNKDILKLSIVEPKRSSQGYWHSCTDSVIATYLAMALFNSRIDKIILVSGDGDFLRTMRIAGTDGKEIDMVGVEGSISKELANFVSMLGGEIKKINENTPGIQKINQDNAKTIHKKGYCSRNFSRRRK